MEPLSPIRVSPSAITAYRGCNLRFGLEYIEKLPAARRAPTPALAFGNAVHKAIARFLRCGGWARLTVDDAIAGLMAVWEPAAFANEETSMERFLAARDQIEAFFYMRFPADVARELEVEPYVSADAGNNVTATGRFDRTCLMRDGKVLVTDWKCGRRPLETDQLETSVQSVFYTILAAHRYKGLKPDGIELAYVHFDGGAPIRVALAADEVADGWAAVEETVQEIRRDRRYHQRGCTIEEAFRPSPGAGCSWCPMRLHCERVGILKRGVA